MKPCLLFILLVFFSINIKAQQNDRGIAVKRAPADTVTRNMALVVGVSSYPNINRLLYADDDAHLFADYLIDQKICEKKDVVLLIDSVATKANFFKELRKLLDKSGEHDRVFIYFAGHGDVENDIESGFLLTYNCEPNNYPATDAIDISMLEKFVAAFTKKNAKVVLITDACRSGNLAGGLQGASLTLSSLSKGFDNVVKILSCQPNQLSQEKKYPEGGHGVFTYHLVDGLSGLADKDNDHFISLRELDRYLDEVADETKQQQVPKTEGDPQTRIAGFSEELKLALVARKEGRQMIADNTKKPRGAGDSTWLNNKYYKLFNEHIKSSRFVSPEKNNAYFAITEAEKAKQPADMVTDLKLELAAILEDEAQKFINQYLRGDLSYDNNTVVKQIQTARSYLETVEKMIGENDIRYNEFHVKKLFFDAYYIFRQKAKQKYPEALACLVKANELIHNQAWITNAMGLFYEDLKKYDEAEASYRAAIRLAPQWSYPWNNLGMFYWYRGKLSEAEHAYKRSLELDSTYGFAWNGLGNVFNDGEKYDDAIHAYRQSIKFNPLDSDPWNGLGNVYSNLGKDEEAEKAYRMAIHTDSTNWFPWNGLGILMENTHQLKEATYYYGRSVSIAPGYVDGWKNLADVWYKLGDMNLAMEAYKKAVELTPLDPDLWNSIGIVLKNEKRYQDAETTYKKGLAIDSINKYLWFNLGILYKLQKQYTDAGNCFVRTVQLEPEDDDNWYHLLECLDKGTDTTKRLYWYEKRFEMKPDETDLAIQIGYLYLLLNDPTKAISYFENVKKNSPEYFYSYRMLASAYALLEKNDEAFKNLEIAFEKGFDDPAELEADEFLKKLRELPKYKELIEKYK